MQKKVKNAERRVQRSCQDFNNQNKGCVKDPKKCPNGKLHTCAKCGLFGHPAYRCRLLGAGKAGSR